MFSNILANFFDAKFENAFPHPVCLLNFSSRSLLYFSSSFKNWALGFLQKKTINLLQTHLVEKYTTFGYQPFSYQKHPVTELLVVINCKVVIIRFPGILSIIQVNIWLMDKKSRNWVSCVKVKMICVTALWIIVSYLLYPL